MNSFRFKFGPDYLSMTIVPHHGQMYLTLVSGDETDMQVTLDGKQFEMLRNLLNDFANHGTSLTTWATEAFIAPVEPTATRLGVVA